MRILITVHQFFPQYKSGTEILVFSLAKELINRGYNVRIFTGCPVKYSPTEKKRFDEYEYEGINIYRFYHSYIPTLNQKSMVDIGYNNKLAEYYFVKIYKSFHPQLVHHFHLNRIGLGVIHFLADAGITQCFTPTDFWMICPTAKLVLNNGCLCNGPNVFSGNCVKHLAQRSVNRFISNIIRVIPDIIFDKITDITKNNQVIHYPMSHEVRAVSHRIDNTVNALNRLQGIISPNNFISKLFIKYGVHDTLIYKKKFGIDLSQSFIQNRFSQDKKQKKKNPLKIVFIGTLAPHKGCDIAIKAVSLLPKNLATLTIFGSGKEFPDYLKKLNNLAKGKKNIFFKGVFHIHEIFSVLNKFDILVVPSIWFENTPLVIYYAQAVHCPVIGSDLPGISSIISHNINGLLFEANNHRDLCKKIQSIKNVDLIKFSKNSIRPKSLSQYTSEICAIWEIVRK